MIMPGECEVCGAPLRGPPITVIIDGSVMKVCRACAKLGRPFKPTRPMPQSKPARRPPSPILREPELELRRDFNIVVRQARERMGLSQEELGRKINEKPSVIRLVESGRLKPDNMLAKKLEHFLKVDMLVPADAEGLL